MEPSVRNWLLIIALDIGGMWGGDEIIGGEDSREDCQRPVPDTHTLKTFSNQNPLFIHSRAHAIWSNFLCVFVVVKDTAQRQTDVIWQSGLTSNKDKNFNLHTNNITLLCKCAMLCCVTWQTVGCWPLWQSLVTLSPLLRSDRKQVRQWETPTGPSSCLEVNKRWGEVELILSACFPDTHPSHNN